MGGILLAKSYDFAIKVVNINKFLTSRRKEFVLSKQLLKAGTSIGANITEAQGGISRADFSAKLSIAYKEALESKYWLRLLKDTGYIENKTYEVLLSDADELSRMLFSAIKTSRK
jgi:four helix bundle protein